MTVRIAHSWLFWRDSDNVCTWLWLVQIELWCTYVAVRVGHSCSRGLTCMFVLCLWPIFTILTQLNLVYFLWCLTIVSTKNNANSTEKCCALLSYILFLFSFWFSLINYCFALQLALSAQGLPSTTKTGEMPKKKTWGFKQQLQQLGQPFGASSSSRAPIVVQQEGRSKLALLLLERWCWGSMSLPVLQELAAAAVDDGLTDPLLRCYLWFVVVFGLFIRWTNLLNPHALFRGRFVGAGFWGWGLLKNSSGTSSHFLSLHRRMAGIGSKGQHANHLHRDLLRMGQDKGCQTKEF